MGTTQSVPNLSSAKLDAVVANNQAVVTALRNLGIFQHDVVTAALTGFTTADLTHVEALANALKAAWNAHVVDANAHVAADTNTTAAAAATDQGTTDTLLNDIKAKFNLHIVVAAAHRGVAGDGRVTTATVATADATDLASSKTLAAALLLAINAHFQNGVPLLAVVDS